MSKLSLRSLPTATRFAALFLFVAGCMHEPRIPDDLDTSTVQDSDEGLYTVSYTSAEEPIPTHRLHSWTLRVETTDGQPVDGAEIAIDGDMPEHGHGLPTEPRVTQELGDGEYLVEGIKFQMDGYWIMDFDIAAAPGDDTVRFHLVL